MIDPTEITEGEIKTFTVSDIPSSWTGNTIDLHYAKVTANAVDCSLITSEPNWDFCENSTVASYNQNTRIYTFELQARSDSVSDPDETFTVTLSDGDDSSRRVTFTLTIREALEVTIAGGTAVTEGAGAQFTVSVSRAPDSNLEVNLNVMDAARSDFVALGNEGKKTVVIPANKASAVHIVPTVNDNKDEANGDVSVMVTDGSGYILGSASTATVRVNDNDEPPADLIQMKNATRSIAEFGEPSNPDDEDSLRVVVDIGDGLSPQGRRTVNYTVGGKAILGTDYKIAGCTSSPCTEVFPAGRHSLIIPIDVINDGLDEDGETIIITLEDGTGYTVNDAKKTTTVTINDDDTRGLTFYRRWPDVDEGASVTYTVKLASQPTAAVTVNIASDNPDVTVSPTSLTFNPSGSNRWNTARTVTIDAAQDNDAVNDEATLTHTTSGGDYGGANALSIDRPVSVDDDETADPITSNLPRISLTGGADVTEGSPASFTVSADPAPTARLTVSVEVSERQGQDFVAGNHEGVRTVTLNAGAASTTFTVPTVDDSTDEDNGAVQVFVNAGTGYDVGQGAVVTVLDNDPAPNSPQLVLSRSSLTVAEGSTGSYTLKLATQPTGTVTVNIASSNNDITVSPNPVTFQSSGSSKLWNVAQTITVTAAQDVDATDDSGTLTHTPSGGGYDSVSGSVSVTVNDDETPPPSVSFASATATATESAGTRNVRVNLSSAAPSGGLTLNYSVTGTATAGSGNDFTIQNSGTLSVSAGATFVTIPITINDDSTEESAETVILTLTSGNGYTVGNPSVHTLTISDNDSTSASFALSASSADEDAGTHNVTVNLSSAAPSGGLTLGYSVSGTATPGSGNDFTIQGSGSLTIAAGATSADIPVAIIDDNAAENAETVILTLTGGSGYTLGGTTVHTLTITDNDSTSAQPSVSFNSTSSSEAESAGTRDVTVTIAPAPSSGFTLSYGVSGTATAGNDFTIQNSGSLTIAAGATSATIPVVINDDSTEESAETVILTLTSGTGYTLGSTTVHTLTITDNETPQPPGTPALQLSSSTLSVSEGGTGSYTVRLATAPTGTGTVIVNIASRNPDVTVNPSSLTFNNSTSLWSTPQTVTVSAAEDPDTINDSATLTHTVSGGGYGRVTGSVTVTVNDDDAPAVSFVSPTSSIAEGDGSNDVTVNLSLVAPVGGLTLGYRVTGTATAGSDFTIDNSGTLTVTAGATTATIPVVINDDNTPENAETVILTLTGGAGYTLGTATVHTLTITNDDGHEVSFTAAEDRIPEGREHTVAVRIFPASDNLTNVSYTISGTATAEEDYEDLPVMVEVPAGESQAVIRIETIADKEDDSGETVILTLQSDMSQELSLGTPSVHTLTIVDSKEAIVEAGRSWLVRFGRSVAEQVVDSISQRLRATRSEGTQINVAGAQVPIGQSRAFDTFEPPTTNRPIDDFDTHSQTSAQGSTQTLSEREVIQSSSFMSVSESDAQGGSFAVWGRATHSSFEGREDKLSLDGDSTSVMLGADYAQQYWQAGATLIQSEGKGEYRDEVISGDAEASITSIVPWAAVQATERVQLWGALGTGDGDLELTEEDSDTLKTNIDWSMAAAGLRSVLVPASGQNGLQLSLVGDALWVETKADPIEGLSITDTDASRLRLGLEGEYASELSSGAEMISRLEFGIREDSGDAETGGGIEIGGGVAWSDASSGLKIELAGRKLLSYDNDELEDEGISLSFDYDPAPGSAEGLSLSLNQEIGVRATGGLEALFDSEPLATRTDGEKENRMRLEAAYGVPVLSGRFIAGPQAAMSRSATTRDYSLGWNVVSARRYEDISLQITAVRSESHDRNPEHGISLGINARW